MLHHYFLSAINWGWNPPSDTIQLKSPVLQCQKMPWFVPLDGCSPYWDLQRLGSPSHGETSLQLLFRWPGPKSWHSLGLGLLSLYWFQFIFTHIYIWYTWVTYVYMYIYYIYIFIFIYIYIFIFIYIYTYLFIYIHIYLYIYIFPVLHLQTTPQTPLLRNESALFGNLGVPVCWGLGLPPQQSHFFPKASGRNVDRLPQGDSKSLHEIIP